MRTMPPRQPIDFADHARKRAEQLAKGRKILEERGLSLQSQSAPSYKESTPRPRPTISTFEVREEVPRQNSSQSLDDRPLGPNSNNMVRGKPAARRDGNVIPVDDVVAAPKRLGSGRRSSFMDEPQQQQQQINTTSSKPNPRSTSPMNSSRSRGSSFSDDIPAQSQHTNGNNFGIIVKEPTKSNIRTSSPRPSSQRNYQPQPPQPPPSYPDEEEEVDVGKELEEQRRQQAERNARLLKEQNQSGDAAMCECPECGRSFRADRIDKHLNVCRKVFGEKRKPFDMTQQRLDSEAMALAKNAEYEKKDTPAPKAKAIPKWKQQSLELQNAMKAARRADDSTAPIPEPIETRVECPYCGRRFADIAAERHIPICKNLSQKTKKPGKH